MDVNSVDFYLKQNLVNTKFDYNKDNISNIERNFRNSLEYKKYIANKRLNYDENKCDLLTDYDLSDAKKTKLELHHVVYLYYIVEMAYNYLLSTGNKNITTFEVENFICELHFKDLIPYIFLTTSAHQLVHDSKYIINYNHVKGNYRELYKEYKEYFSKDGLTQLEDLIQHTKED